MPGVSGTGESNDSETVGYETFFAFTGLCMALGLATPSAFAGATQYPLTLDNCGVKVTFDKAPERAVGLGQASAEIMLLFGPEDRMVGTAF